MEEVRFENIRFSEQAMLWVKKLYYNSFPPEERRTWSDIERLLATASSPYNIDLILHGGEFVGFISWWQFLDFCYVEHFAVESARRGVGIGARAISQFVERSLMPVVLEVELPRNGEIAQRRIAFYLRNGFVAHPDFEYIQPSYGDGLPSVPLMLMTARISENVNLKHLSRRLREVVYGVK